MDMLSLCPDTAEAYQRMDTTIKEVLGRMPKGNPPVVRDHKYMTQTLDAILGMWHKHPQLRLGQLLINAVPEQCMYNVNDDKLVESLKGFTKEYEDNIQPRMVESADTLDSESSG